LHGPAIGWPGPERRTGRVSRQTAVLFGDQPWIVTGTIAKESAPHLLGAGRLFLEADRAVLDIGPVDGGNSRGVLLACRPDQESHSLNNSSKLRSRARRLAGTTAGHSRQRAWMLGPDRIDPTSAIADASCRCGC